MHILQPKHAKLKADELKVVLNKYRISVSQLPKIKSTDPALPEGCLRGEVIKIERTTGGVKQIYYRVIS